MKYFKQAGISGTDYSGQGWPVGPNWLRIISGVFLLSHKEVGFRDVSDLPLETGFGPQWVSLEPVLEMCPAASWDVEQSDLPPENPLRPGGTGFSLELNFYHALFTGSCFYFVFFSVVFSEKH